MENDTRNTTAVRDTVAHLANFLEDTMYDPWSIGENSEKVRVIKKNTKTVWAGVKKSERMNVLGMIMCSVAFGAALSRLGSQGKLLLDIFEQLLKIVMSLVNAVMW